MSAILPSHSDMISVLSGTKNGSCNDDSDDKSNQEVNSLLSRCHVSSTAPAYNRGLARVQEGVYCLPSGTVVLHQFVRGADGAAGGILST